jgi:hypothetical protein
MRSLSHELIHHKQNCDGQFDGASEMGEGYAQKDEHLREMEREAYEQGNLVFRDWEDSIKGTIYNESLQKGAKKNMSTKDWKNRELPTLLTEKWGFSFNVLTESQSEELDEAKHEDEELDEGAASGRAADPSRAQSGDRREDDERKRPMEENEQIFAPNHYCVHHGGVQRNGSVELAEAVAHNYNEELGRVTHYDMKFTDGTIMENVAFEDIQVTHASLAEGHGSHPAKSDHKDKKDEELDEGEKPDFPDVDGDGDREEPISKASKEKKEKEGGKKDKSEKDLSKVPPQLRKHMKKKMNESQIRQIIKKLVKEAMAKKAK